VMGSQLAVSQLRELMKHGRMESYTDEKLSQLAIGVATIFIHSQILVLKIFLHPFGEDPWGLSV